MNSSCGHVPSSSQVSDRSPGHIQEFGNNLGKMIRGFRRGKKHQSPHVPSLFVPAAVQIGEGVSNLPPAGLEVGSVPLAQSHAFLSPTPLGATRRRVSAPQQLNREDRGNGDSLGVVQSSLSTNCGMDMLLIDTGDGDETAGSGMNYISSLSESESWHSSSTTQGTEKERMVERLASIRSVIDERSRMLKVVNEDIDRLQMFLTQRLSEVMPQHTDEQQELVELQDEVIELQESVDELRRESPQSMPPPVPSRPHGFRVSDWSCLDCTMSNGNDAFRCANCLMPSLKIDPIESELCKCALCSNMQM